jgi:hypothetical protein
VAYEHYLNPSVFNSTIYEELEAKLGPERYQQTQELGNKLTLSSALAAVAEQLDRKPAQRTD